MNHRIFISYAKEDQKTAKELYDLIKSNDFSPWMDEKEIKVGENWRQKIEEAIGSCSIFIACLSKNSVTKRGFIQDELKQALDVLRTIPDREIYLMPIRFDPCKLPARLSEVQYVDYFESTGPKKLIRAIAECLESPSPTTMHLESRRPLALGVDVGTTKIATGILSFQDKKEPDFILTNRIGHEEIGSKIGILDRIEKAIHELLQTTEIGLQRLEYVGIGMPGQVDPRTGILKFAPGLRLKNIQVKRELSRRLGCQVFVENDCRCATIAELNFGQAGRLFKDFVCISIGTGIGSGIVIDRQLLHGHHFGAGEIGHMTIDWSPSARKCNCGSRGCFEEYASARAIIRLAREKIFEMRRLKESGLLPKVDPNTISPEDLIRLIKKRDRAAVNLAKEIASFLAIGFANIAKILNPEAIVLGGGVIEGFFEFDFFNRVIQDKFNEYTLDVCSQTEILTPTFKQAAVVGAASLGLDNIKKQLSS